MNLSLFWASLVYKASFRPARVPMRPCLKKKHKQKSKLEFKNRQKTINRQLSNQTANKSQEKMFSSLAIREMQIKTTMMSSSTKTAYLPIKKDKCQQECTWRASAGEVENSVTALYTVWQLLQKLQLLYRTDNLFTREISNRSNTTHPYKY